MVIVPQHAAHRVTRRPPCPRPLAHAVAVLMTCTRLGRGCRDQASAGTTAVPSKGRRAPHTASKGVLLSAHKRSNRREPQSGLRPSR